MSKEDSDTAQIYQLLAGADKLKEQLMALLAIGPNNLYSECYAVKARVKSVPSVREKLSRKRTDDPLYGADRVTDVLGLRLLTLYSSELAHVTRSFLAFIEFLQSPRVQLAKGQVFVDCLQEIIIYKSPSSSSSNYKMVYSVVSPLLGKSGQAGLLQDKTSPDDQPYSSIHIVFYCTMQVDGVAKQIPVEVQIRTIFEDAWNEVDHPLRYKGFLSRSGGLSNEEVSRQNSTKILLSMLKEQLDHSGKHADLVRSDCFELESAYRSRSTTNVATTMTVRNQFHLEPTSRLASGSIADKFVGIEGRALRSCSEAIWCNLDKAQTVLQALNESLRDLEDLDSNYQLNEPAAKSVDSDYHFHTSQLRALILFRRLGLELMMGSLTASGAENSRNDSMNLMYDLEQDPRFAPSAYIKLRVANCWYSLGQGDLALEKLHEASISCANDVRLKKEGFVPALIHRQLAAYSQARRVQIAMEGEAYNLQGHKLDEQRRLVEQAITSSCRAYEALKSCTVAPNGQAKDTARELNNFITYVWDYRTLTGELPSASLAPILKELSYGDIAESIRVNYGSAVLSASILDTAAKALILNGDRGKARELIPRLEQAIESDRKSGNLTVEAMWELQQGLASIKTATG